LPAQLSPQGWQTEVGCFGVTGAETAQADLMVRQEDMALVEDAKGAVVVRDRQFLGREYKYCLQTPSGQWLYARLPMTSAIEVGSRVQITVPSQRLRLYAPQEHGVHSPLSASPR
jgi:iron(III) transport system ATP-binding protein